MNPDPSHRPLTISGWLLPAALCLLFSVSCLFGQGATEPAAQASSLMGFPTEWPSGPGPDSVPEWARPGKIRFARWDGGRLETAKAMLSGWPGFNPPIPDYVDTMTNWYGPRSLQLLEEASINTIWVTFSVGFSNPTELGNQRQLRAYIEECHRRGIRVITYQSIANIFWEDMFQKVPQSRDWVRLNADGKPTPYGSGMYEKLGRITRYMAKLSSPEWRACLRGRIDLALDAGADGIMYDNNFHEYLYETYRELYQYASSRKPNVLMMGNFHSNSYVLNRVLNALSTEDGLEPGIYEASDIAGRLDKLRATLLAVPEGHLVTNIGLFRIHSALSEGWKPVQIEDGHRQKGDRFQNPISAAHHKIALAEGTMFSAATQVFSEGAFANGLMRNEPAAMDIWRAIARYNRFFADNSAFYVDARPVASAAVILDDRSEDVALLNGLAARNVQFDVLYAHDLTPARLVPYSAAAVLSAGGERPSARAALGAFAARGGKVFAAPKTLPPVDELAAALRAAGPPAKVEVQAPPTVLYNVNSQARAGRLVLHLLNYSSRPGDGIRITVNTPHSGARLFTPDDARQPLRIVRQSGATSVYELPRLETYALIVLEGAR